MEEKQELPEKQIGKKTGTINRTLLELLAGILFWGVVCQAVGVWMVKDKPGYSIGLWIGVLLALLAGTHMWWALDRFLGYAGDAAVKMITKNNITRYVAIVVVMALVMVSGCANPLSAFLGLMGLKVAAYLQPFTHKICAKFYHEQFGTDG